MNLSKLVSFGILATLLNSCSSLTQKQISRNCDELAVKFLETAFSRASENGGRFPKEVLTVRNEIKIPNSEWSEGITTRYKISPSGLVTKSTNREFMWTESDKKTSLNTYPMVLTTDQIACHYKTLFTTSVKNGVPKWGFIDVSSNLPQAGEEHTVTEDNDYIRW